MLKKGPLNVLICYVLWGILPLFWGLLGDLSALGVLGYRILFSLLLVGGYLLLTGQWPQVRKVLGNRKEMRRLAASGLVIAVNWGSFIWAVNSGHVLDSSLAYYMYPILSIFIGAVFFREKLGLLQWAAVVLMTAGVAVTAVGQGVFPWLALVIGGLLYISAFSLVYLKKAYDHCLELGITRKELSNVIKSSLIFSVVPSLSIVVGLFVLIAVLGSVWAWWRLSVIGSLSYETMISSSIAQVLGYASSAEMLESATGRQFGVVMILMSVGMLSGFLILLPLGKKLCKSVDRSAAENGGSTWKNVLSGVFMLVMFSVYIPILLFTDNVQAAVMITGLVIAIGVGVLAKRPGLAWLNNFVMAFSMLGGLISSLAWVCLLYTSPSPRD